MAELTVPPAMVEAAARSLHDIDCPDRTCSDTIVGSVYMPRARRILAAALSVCEVREERRARWPDYERVVPDYVTTWTVGHLGSLAPGAAIDYRLVITTPAEEATDGQ